MSKATNDCPRCSGLIEGGSVAIEEEWARQDVHCTDCDWSGTDFYQWKHCIEAETGYVIEGGQQLEGTGDSESERNIDDGSSDQFE